MLSLADLNTLRASALSGGMDYSIPEANMALMARWTKAEAEEYFRSGGLFLPPRSGYKPPPEEVAQPPPQHPAASKPAPAPELPAAKPTTRKLQQSDGSPIPMLPDGKSNSVSNPDPEKILFLHGFGDSVDLLDAFGLDGLRKTFGKQCTVQAIEGPYKLTHEEIEEHMVEGDLKDMALEGDLDLFSWCEAGVCRQNGVDFVKGLARVESELLTLGGADIIVGFSDGGQMIFQLLSERLAQLQPRLMRKIRMIVLIGVNDAPFSHEVSTSPHVLNGIKVMHLSGNVDGGFCNVCREHLEGGYFRCAKCYDVDFCRKCHADGAVALAKLPKSDKFHTIACPMVQKSVGEMLDPANLEMLVAKGVEVAAAQYPGGHVMPKAGDKAYEWLAKFYRGELDCFDRSIGPTKLGGTR